MVLLRCNPGVVVRLLRYNFERRQITLAAGVTLNSGEKEVTVIQVYITIQLNGKHLSNNIKYELLNARGNLILHCDHNCGLPVYTPFDLFNY